MWCMCVFNFCDLIDIICIFFISLFKGWFFRRDYVLDLRFWSGGY